MDAFTYVMTSCLLLFAAGFHWRTTKSRIAEFAKDKGRARQGVLARLLDARATNGFLDPRKYEEGAFAPLATHFRVAILAAAAVSLLGAFTTAYNLDAERPVGYLAVGSLVIVVGYSVNLHRLGKLNSDFSSNGTLAFAAITATVWPAVFVLMIAAVSSDAAKLRLFQISSYIGSPYGQTGLGVMYETGRAVPRDSAAAAKWYKLAAERGHMQAQHNLGVLYQNGRGVPQDEAEAARWYRLAAEQGHPGAQNNLGVLYEAGRGVPHDRGQAVRWYRKAAELGEAAARKNLDRVYRTYPGYRRYYREEIDELQRSREDR